MKSLFLALPLLVLSSAAFAGGLTVTNNSGLPIDELTASPAGKSQFSANLMEGVKEGALDNGKTVTIADLKDGKYDFQLSAPDEGILCTIKDAQVKGGKIVFTPTDGKTCK